MVGKVHTGDTLTDFQLLVQETLTDGSSLVFNLADATTKQMVFTDPDGVETIVTASALNGAGTDGILRFVNNSITINKSGFWKHRAKLTLSGGAIYQSNDAIFEVI